MTKLGIFVFCFAALLLVTPQLLAVDSAVVEAVLAGDWEKADVLLDAGPDDSDPVKIFLMERVCMALDRECASFGYEGAATEPTEMWPCWEWIKALKKNNPDNAVAVYLDAEAEALTGSFAKARVAYTKALELDENFVLGYFSRGALLYAMGIASKAIEDYSRALDLRPDFSKALINRGMVYDYMGEYWKAIADYKTVLKLGKDSATAHYNRGNSYRALGENGNAILDFSAAIRADSGLGAAYFNRANTYLDTGEPEKAAADYRSFLRHAPDEMSAQKEIATELIRNLEGGGTGDHPSRFARRMSDGSRAFANGHYGKAIQVFTEVLKGNPSEAEAYYWRGVAYARLGSDKLAIRDFSRAIELRPDESRALIERGIVYNDMGDYWKAVGDYYAVLWLGEDSVAALYFKGISYRYLGENDEAIVDFTAAIEIDSGFAPAYYDRANTQLDEKRPMSAANDYRRFLECAPDEAETQKEIAAARIQTIQNAAPFTDMPHIERYMFEGAEHYENDRYTAAVKSYGRAIEIDPSYSSSYYWRGVAYMNRGSDESAIEDFSQAIELHPNDTTAFFNRATCYSRRRQYAEAASDFTKAISLQSGYARALYGRAWAHEMLGDYERAVEDYRQLWQHSTAQERLENPGAQEAISFLSVETRVLDTSPVVAAAEAAYEAVVKCDWPTLAAIIEVDDLGHFRQVFTRFLNRAAVPGRTETKINGVPWNFETAASMDLLPFFEKAMESIYPADIPRYEWLDTKFLGIVDVAFRGEDRALCRVRIRSGIPDTQKETVRCYELRVEDGRWKVPYEAFRWWLRR